MALICFYTWCFTLCLFSVLWHDCGVCSAAWRKMTTLQILALGSLIFCRTYFQLSLRPAWCSFTFTHNAFSLFAFEKLFSSTLKQLYWCMACPMNISQLILSQVTEKMSPSLPRGGCLQNSFNPCYTEVQKPWMDIHPYIVLSCFLPFHWIVAELFLHLNNESISQDLKKRQTWTYQSGNF